MVNGKFLYAIWWSKLELAGQKIKPRPLSMVANYVGILIDTKPQQGRKFILLSKCPAENYIDFGLPNFTTTGSKIKKKLFFEKIACCRFLKGNQ